MYTLDDIYVSQIHRPKAAAKGEAYHQQTKEQKKGIIYLLTPNRVVNHARL
jgi:hypothetical protein